MYRQDFADLLGNAINSHNQQEIYYALQGLITQNQQVDVKLIKNCLLHPNAQWFIEDDLYFCIYFHTFCKECLENYFFQQFEAYGDSVEYYCPICQNITLYQTGKKNIFLNTIFGDSNQLFMELSGDSQEYMYVYGLFFMELIDKNKFRLDSVIKVNNPGLQSEFERLKQELLMYSNRVVQVWHGTKSLEIYKRICGEGFKIGGVDVKAKNGVAYGLGVNTGLDPLISLHYTEDCGYLLLCDALPGTISKVPRSQKNDSTGHSYRAGNAQIFYNKFQVLPRYLLKITKFS